MKNYYCPYCSTKYQFQKKSATGELICGLCGDSLVKKPFIKVNQIVAIIACLSLILPLFYSIIFLIRNQINPQRRNYQANANLIQNKSKLEIHQPLQSDFFKHE